MSSCLLMSSESETAPSLAFRTWLGYNKEWKTNPFEIFFYL